MALPLWAGGICLAPLGLVFGRSLCERRNTSKRIALEICEPRDGGFVAEALCESIFTQADTWTELRANVREAVTAFYFDRPAPVRVRLHQMRDEMLA
jgi:hypothetical protein